MTHSNGGEGGITHRSTPRPFGAALTGVIPLRRCLRRLIAGNTAYHLAERVGLLVAPLLAPSGPPWRALSPLRRCLGRLIDAAKNLPIIWRRGWDSNPRTRLGVTHFPGVRLRPLGHLSINLNLLEPPGGCDSNPRTPFGVLLTFQASAFDHSATSPRGRKGTGGDPSDQIYGGAEPEGSWTGGTEGWAGAGGAVRISLAALLGGAGL